jgi:hypothetical protein
MMNRTALGLAIGAGYLLGRTKKLKMALAVGGLVAGKRLNLAPGAVGELLTRQLKDNPQFKEIGDELRDDLRGVGKAASGALVERQMSALADRLHDRTADVRDQLSDTVSGIDGTSDEHDEEQEDQEDQKEPEDQEEQEEPSGEDDSDRDTDAGHEKHRGRDTDGRSRGSRESHRDDESAKADEDGRPSRRRTSGGAPTRKTTGKGSAAKKTTARKTSNTTRRAAHAGGRQGGDER